MNAFVSYDQALTKDEAYDVIYREHGFSASVIIGLEEGWLGFEFMTDYAIWENQK